MVEFALIGLAFGVGYAWANLGRRLHPISTSEVFWGGEPVIRDDGTYSDVGRMTDLRGLKGDGFYLFYRANDGEVLDGGVFKGRRAARAWRPAKQEDHPSVT